MGTANNQIILIFILSGALVVLVVTILLLFVVIYQKRIVSQENRLQKLENERQQSLLLATIEGQERERQRLAKDLHDGIGSLLSGLSLNLKFQKKRENSDSEQWVFLNEACSMVEEGIRTVRTVSHNLIPNTLENFGLVSAMKECSEYLDQKEGPEINIVAANPPYPIPKNTSLGLLRVFQELLQNTIKHSGASRVLAELNYGNDFLVLKYEDNGKGLDQDYLDSNGIGIKNMQSRVQALFGKMEISAPGEDGFRAQIQVPIQS